MTCLRCQLRALIALGVGAWCASASAQVSSPFSTETLTPLPIQQQMAVPLNIGAQPPQLIGREGSPGVPGTVEAKESSEELFRKSNTGVLSAARFGYGSGQVSAAMPLGQQFNLPLLSWEAKPEDAEFKLGRFYLHVRAIEAAVLASDNISLTESNRRWGSVSEVRMELALIYQINEALRLTAGGTVVWLPFKNEFGFNDPLADFQLSLIPQALFQLNYTIPVAGWDLTLFDQFFVRQGGVGTGQSFDLLNRNVSVIEDRAGRYSFQERQAQSASDRRFQRGVEYHNDTGFSTSRVLPTETRLTFGFTHSEVFYSQNPENLPQSVNNGSVSLESERENLRFKPFATYAATGQSSREGWDQQVHGGVRGPVTDYLDFLGDGGYFFNDSPSQRGILWRLRLTHNPRASTRHSLEFSRNVTYPVRDLETTIEYRIEQGIGPELLTELALQRVEFDSLDNPTVGSIEKRAEGRVTWAMNPRATLRVGLSTAQVHTFTPGSAQYNLTTGRIEFRHQTYGTLYTTVIYQHQRRDSNLPLDSYYENLVTLTLRKTF